MPELPEVETVRRGLAPHVIGARIERVHLARPDLRFPFPTHLAETLTGTTVEAMDRRAKYLLFTLSSGWALLSHLGMTGAWRFAGSDTDEPSRLRASGRNPAHDHLSLGLTRGSENLTLIYNDPRRFGFIDLVAPGGSSPYLTHLGPEPTGNELSAEGLAPAFARRAAPVKVVLLDQTVIAGLGNIYVSEALWRAGISPSLPARDLVQPDGTPSVEMEALVAAIRGVLADAIAAGGSTLRDFRNAEGDGGYFQHSFDVYGRDGEPCRTPDCAGSVQRIVQSGRATFYCPQCQRK